MNRRPDLPTAAPADLLGVVLAGGQSSRMGFDKAALTTTSWPSGDQPPPSSAPLNYLQFALQRLRPLVRHRAVAGRSQAQLGGLLADQQDVLALPDAVPHQGPAMGLCMALAAAVAGNWDAVLVTPVDMPELTTHDLAPLVASWRADRRITCASCSGERPEPLLAIYPAGSRAAIDQLANSSDRSLSRWLRCQAVQLVRLPARAATNVNRPSDLRRGGNARPC